MSKVTKALEVIKDNCDKTMYCDMCELKYIDEKGQIGCSIGLWIYERRPPRDWPIEDIRKAGY